MKDCNIFESNSASFVPSCSLEPTNSCFAPLKAISDRDLETIFTPLWAIAFRRVTCINLWWSVKDLRKNALKCRGHVPLQTYLHQIIILFWVSFLALIDNPNNFESNTLIGLVVSEMFLLPYFASLINFPSFYSHFLETLSKMDTFLKWPPSKADTLFWSCRCPL